MDAAGPLGLAPGQVADATGRTPVTPRLTYVKPVGGTLEEQAPAESDAPSDPLLIRADPFRSVFSAPRVAVPRLPFPSAGAASSE